MRKQGRSKLGSKRGRTGSKRNGIITAIIIEIRAKKENEVRKQGRRRVGRRGSKKGRRNGNLYGNAGASCFISSLAFEANEIWLLLLLSCSSRRLDGFLLFFFLLFFLYFLFFLFLFFFLFLLFFSFASFVALGPFRFT